ncbi:MAG TPA: type I methionyl aminopeptidase, partial [Candidatus Paceibacterota bacterium]
EYSQRVGSLKLDMIIRTQEERDGIRAAGKLLSEVLRDVVAHAKAGVIAKALDERAEELIRAGGAVPVFLNYRVEGIRTPYPATLCISINDGVVHGIPSDYVLKEGDIVSLDCGLSLNGFISDSATTIIIGKGSDEDERLLEATRKALHAGIAAARAGGTTGDIGAAVEAVAKQARFTVVRDLGGHGTGRQLHESPHIANFGAPGRGEKLVEGMVLALEPIFTTGGGAIKLDSDGWTYRTRDHSHAAHFEHTIIVGKNGSEIVTQ